MTLNENIFGLSDCVVGPNDWRMRYKREDLSHAACSRHDPFVIPEVNEKIQEDIARAKAKSAKLTHIPRPIFRAIPSQHISYEIRVIILDLVRDWHDAENLIVAGGWEALDDYWRKRFPSELIIEMDAVDSDVDWMFLCLETGRLQRTCHGLINRQRILKVLETTKRHFVFLGGITGSKTV